MKLFLTAYEVKNKCMLLAGWEVRIGKNCDRGLENAAHARGFTAGQKTMENQD